MTLDQGIDWATKRLTASMRSSPPTLALMRPRGACSCAIYALCSSVNFLTVGMGESLARSGAAFEDGEGLTHYGSEQLSAIGRERIG